MEKPKNLGMFQAYFPGAYTPYTIVPKPGEQNAYVQWNKPNEVTIDPTFSGMPGIYEHEFEHQLNRKAEQRYFGNKRTDPNNTVETRPEVKFWYENASDLGLSGASLSSDLKRNTQKAVITIDKLLKEKTGQGLDPRSRLWNSSDEILPEVLAELSAMESVLNMDFTKDKTLRKQIFNDNEKFAQLYRSVTSGRQDRLDAKDLPPYTVQIQEKSPMQYITDLFFDKVKF